MKTPLPLLLLVTVLVSASILSGELPATSEPAVVTGPTGLDHEGMTAPLTHGTAKPGDGLRQMPSDEKANAIVRLCLPEDAPSGAVDIATLAEMAWDRGDYDAAANLVDKLEREYRLEGTATCVRYKEPIPVSSFPKGFGTDVQIDTIHSVEDFGFAINRVTGRMMIACLTSHNTYASYLPQFISSDSGETWSKSGWFAYNSETVTCSDLTAGYTRFYQVHAVNNTVYATMFNGYTGIQEQIGSDYFRRVIVDSSGTDANDVVAASTEEDGQYGSTRLYAAAVFGSGELRIRTASEAAITWTERRTYVHDAERGLSMTFNQGYSTYRAFVSYIDETDTLRIGSLNVADSYDHRWSLGLGSGSPDITSMSAWHDTVYCAYEYHGGRLYNRYYVSYDGGTTFLYGAVDDTTTTQEKPAIRANEAGVAMIYRYYTSPRQGRFCSRDIGGSWESPETFADHEPYYMQPCIEYIGNGQFGMVYASRSYPVARSLFFDRGKLGCCTGLRGNIDGSVDEEPSLGDLTVLIDHLFVSFEDLECWEEGNLDESTPEGATSISLGDLTVLIDLLFISFDDPAPCP